jgi:hypothetical protein
MLNKYMPTRNNNPEGSNKSSADYYDMTEEASKRPQQGGTQEARQSESDDLNEEASQGPVSSPSGDSWAENKVSTSLDEE